MQQRFRKLVCWFTAMGLLFSLAACGGGGGGTTAETSTLSGSVEFPAVTGKVMALTQTDTTVDIFVYDLKGNQVKKVNPTYNDATPTRIYAYSVSGLTPGVAYVIKAKKGLQIIKKLIEKEKVVVGQVSDMKVDTVSTTAVAIAEQKLKVALGLTAAFTLGNALPAGVTETAMSTKITEVRPAFLEQSISTFLQSNGRVDPAKVIDAATAQMANVFMIVVKAVESNVEPTAFVQGSGTSSLAVEQYTVSAGVVTAPTAPVNVSSTEAATASSTAATNYTAPTSVDATPFVTAAKAFLAEQKISEAANSFQKALAIDPANKDAIFGASMTRVILLVEKTEVKDIITKLGGVAPTANQLMDKSSPVGNPFQNFTSLGGGSISPFKTVANVPANSTKATAQAVFTLYQGLKAKLPQPKAGKTTAKTLASVPATAPTISELQAVVDNAIVPELKAVLALLKKVEAAGYTFTVTGSMQGNVSGQSVVIGTAEVYALEALVDGALALLNVTTSYNLDVKDYDANGVRNDYDKVKFDPLATLTHADFLTLKTTDGGTKMAAALQYLRDAVAAAKLGYADAKTRTAPTSGQWVIDLSTWIATDHTNFTDALTKIEGALAGVYTVTLGNGKSLTFNATKFFTTPLTKANLPKLGYDVAPDAALSIKYDTLAAGERSYVNYLNQTVWYPINSEIVPTSDLPDYTLNGILPGNTSANNVAEFNGILPVRSGALLTGAQADRYDGFTTDGTDIFAVAYDNNSGSTVIKKITTAGVVSTYATQSQADYTYVNGLVWFNSKLYALNWSGSLAPLVISGSTFTVNTAQAIQLTLGQNENFLPYATSNGTTLYYTVGGWGISGNYTKVYSLVGTTKTLLFTYDDGTYFLGYSNGNLFHNSDKRNASTGELLANYIGRDASAIVGGYFYDINDGKIIQYAGTPQNGTAKVLARFF